MRVRLLGPVDVVGNGMMRPVSGLRRKAVLAVLALSGGDVVSSDRLGDVLWGDAPPATARNTLQRHVSHLRGLLGSRAAIVARPPGYLLDAGSVDTDVADAERLIGEGARVADRAHERQLRDALALWRGPALADVGDLPWLREQAGRLARLQLQGSRALARTLLALGDHERLLPDLEELTREHPFDEQLHAHLMLALYRSGRQAEALAAYRRLRERLSDELAIEPGRELRELQAAVLRQDRALDLRPAQAPAVIIRPPARPAAGPPAAVRPAAASPPAMAGPAATGPAASGPGHADGREEPLLERAESLATLRELAAEADGGTGRVVLIGGEAGVGKSVLIERLQRELPAARWSWGTCDGLFTPRPLGPLFDLADQLGGPLLERCSAGAGREELFRALLRQVSAPGTLDVVVIEDIHWADEATLDLLRYLSRRLRGAQVLLIASYRDDEVAASGPLRVALGDLAEVRWTRRVELAPLSARAVGELAAGSGLAPEELYRLTGGNPFFVSEVLCAGMDKVPLFARDAVLARAARLSRMARELLDVAALVGTRVEVRVLQLVAACTPAEPGCLPAALDELLAGGLLAGDGGWVRFRHEIARLAVAQALSAHREAAIHAVMLMALEGSGCEDDARMAFHAEGAGAAGQVMRYAPAAASRAARLGAHREAAAQYERALRFAREAGTSGPALAALHEGLAGEAGLLDRWQEAADAQERALALWRAEGDRLREGGALWRLSRIRWNLCHGDEALAAAQGAVAVLDALDEGPELARAYATYANQRMLSGDHVAATDLARRAQELATRLGVLDVVSDALNTEAMSRADAGQPWAALLRRALDIALAGGYHPQAARAYANLAGKHIGRREFAQAEPYLAEGIAFCEEHDITAYARCLRIDRALLLEGTGHWDEAARLCADLLRAEIGRSSHRPGALALLALLRARRGEPGVWEYLDEALVIAIDAASSELRLAVRLVRVEAHWLEGDVAAARREAELGCRSSRAGDPWLLGAIAAWLRRTGSPVTISASVAGPYRLLLGGDAEAAADAWDRLGCPYEAALALADGGHASGVRQAQRIMTDLGASRAAARLRGRLASLSPQPVAAGRPEALG